MSILHTLCVTVLAFIACFSLLPSVWASGLAFGEGATLFYTGAKISTSGQGGYSTWNSSITMLEINQTSLVLLSNSTYEDSNMNAKLTISYKDGIPTYADYLTALIYLPPECIAESQRGNLEWATRISTSTNTNVANKTSKTLNFTVAAGEFQSINITLSLTGMDFGTLTLIYDLASGILTFEMWVPSYGDIITLSLTSENVTPDAGSVLLDLILPIAVFAIPAAMGIDKTSKKLRRRRKHALQPDAGESKEGFRRFFYITLGGALLSLVSVLLPWGQLLGVTMYLPLSLPLVFSNSSALWTHTMITVSLVAHLAAVLAWASLAMEIYARRKLAPWLVAVASGLLAFVASSLFIGTGWTLSGGLLTTVAAGILAIFGAAAMKKNGDARA